MCWSISRYFLVRDVKKGIWIHTMAAIASISTNAKSVALKADACLSRQELSANMHEQCKTVPEYSFYESTIYIIYVWLRTCSQFTASCFSSAVSGEDRKTDTKGSFSCRSAAERRGVCNTECSPQLSCLLSPAQTVFKDQQ